MIITNRGSSGNAPSNFHPMMLIMVRPIACESALPRFGTLGPNCGTYIGEKIPQRTFCVTGYALRVTRNAKRQWSYRPRSLFFSIAHAALYAFDASVPVFMRSHVMY